MIKALSWAHARASGLRFGLVLLLVFAVFLGGGGSRADIVSLLYVRPLAVVIATILLVTSSRIDMRPLRVPLILLGLFALSMVIQLVPLPAEVWTKLPGQAAFAKAYGAAGVKLPWRPLSIAPDLTLNSLAALVVPAAAAVALSVISPERQRMLLPILIGLIIFSAMLGVAQLTGGPQGRLYFYDVTNAGSGVGLFANRNHQAVFLAAGFPMLATWASEPVPDQRQTMRRFLIAILLGLLLVPMILATGSRAGLLLAALGILVAMALLKRGGELPPFLRPWRTLLTLVPIGLAGLSVASALLFSRADSMRRLFAAETLNDERFSNLPLFVRMAWDFLPLGSGQGTFDRLFRIYEPDERLRPTYLNHAHNDLLELIITGGIPALLVLLGFLFWWGQRSWTAMTAPNNSCERTLFSRLGASLILILLLGSIVDYPLRTPSLAFFFVLACAWLSRPRSEPEANRRRNYGKQTP